MNKTNKEQDLLILKDWELETYIGCLDWEKVRKQKLSITFKFQMDNKLAANSDNPVDCVEYISLTKNLRAMFADSHHNLIETLADKIAAEVLLHPLVRSVKIEVKKFGVIKSANYASVKITRAKA